MPPSTTQCGADDASVAAGIGQQFCMQRDFKGAAHFKDVDIAFGVALIGHLGDKTFTALVDDIFVPAGLDERDTLVCVAFAFAVDCGWLHVF
ncbi:hypothetical protein PSYJA_06883 [Pseudomonas syringae pv. japonica str. M301072]|uniref:Uncharacterized protein n=1 Tax=Pseudomonas syringae pv. japonica str. M301072 TaxID=629262 RepID=F3FES6_PSESX|nr:hypothetical protein PSYJA_06883 [Pseudomonas syringae pv. japonica str. M301072]